MGKWVCFSCKKEKGMFATHYDYKDLVKKNVSPLGFSPGDRLCENCYPKTSRMGYNVLLIIGGVFGGAMLLIALQLLLPFPYGLLGFVLYLIILAVCISKRKKIPSSISSPSKIVPQLKTQDDTQFWVCPNCGNDTQMKDGRQYCSSCKMYL